MFTGRRIVVIATGLRDASENGKTGDMIQTHILSDEGEKPTDAVKSGKDESVCGDCPHRGKACYPNIGQAQRQVYEALLAGNYPRFNRKKHLRLFKGRLIRLGTYGDPAAVPYHIWAMILPVTAGRTGYTHRWKYCDQDLRKWVMASCDTPLQRLKAQEMGWRTFRVRVEGAPLMAGEFTCPASAEAGKRLTCEECLACDGTTASAKAACPTLVVHGLGWKAQRFAETVARLEQEERDAAAGYGDEDEWGTWWDDAPPAPAVQDNGRRFSLATI